MSQQFADGYIFTILEPGQGVIALPGIIDGSLIKNHHTIHCKRSSFNFIENLYQDRDLNHAGCGEYFIFVHPTTVLLGKWRTNTPTSPLKPCSSSRMFVSSFSRPPAARQQANQKTVSTSSSDNARFFIIINVSIMRVCVKTPLPAHKARTLVKKYGLK
jgi:hypothetical protein